MTSTLLAQIDDALTGAAIVIGGAFAYLKFIEGRVLTAAVGYEIMAVVTTHVVARRHLPRRPPRRVRHSRPHDGGELFRDALGDLICEICGRTCDDEGADPGRDV